MNILIKPSFYSLWGIYRYLFSGILFSFFFLGNPFNVNAQRVALRTNLLEWVVASPNFGVEFTLSNSLSLECALSGSPWRMTEDLYLKHIRFQPELKYWFQNLLSKHYIGITAFYDSYDVGLRSKAYYGDAYAVGLTYGYDWILSRRWNLGASAGVGAIRYRQDKYTPDIKHDKPNEFGWKFAPVKLEVSLIYLIK